MNSKVKLEVPEGDTSSFQGWSRAEVIANAKESCTHCMGLGLLASRSVKPSPCKCVLREIFRACYRKFRSCAEAAKHMTSVRLEVVMSGSGRPSRSVWGRKSEEYCADFVVVSQRVLTAEEYRLFKFHYLLGADWKLCCRQLNMDRGTFFHAAYRIEQKLGRTFRELKPYSMFPLDEYFGGRVEGRKVPATVIPITRKGLRPPMRMPAPVALPDAA